MLAVAAGGAVGAMARYLTSVALMSWLPGAGFPLATFAVNVLGSFAMGAIVEGVAQGWRPGTAAQLALTAGFLGAFTTFSTFSLEAWQLVERGRALIAFAYVAGSLVCGMAGLVMGVALARRLAGA